MTATIHAIEARKGKREHWLRYSLTATAEQASVWALFPESRPYNDYRLIRYATADPSMSREPLEAKADELNASTNDQAF